jgi:hypothetical protein
VSRPLPEPEAPEVPEPLALPQRFVLLVALTPQMHEQLEARAHHDGANMANVARKAIAAYLRPRQRPRPTLVDQADGHAGATTELRP